MKRIFTFFFALLSACTFSAYAAIVDGTCGDNLTWTLNTEDSTLVIAGEGNMQISFTSSAPWYDYRSYIKYVTLPDGLTSIGNYAFMDCTSLTSITIPNSVTSIGYRAFEGCSGLTSVTLSNSVTSIGEYAFAYCDGLTSITIPNSVTSIGDGAFSSCDGLTSIIVEQGNAKYDCRENCNAIIETATNTLISGCQNTIIPNSVTSIGSYAFRGCTSLTSITIPNSVTSIGGSAFRNCSGLTSITIPNSVTSIEGWAFEYCSSLTSVTLGNSVTSIGQEAFYGCRSLTSITIPNSVTSIGYRAFGTCTRLTSVTLGNSVTSIGKEAFSGCDGLTSITIPNSVTSIGDEAFRACSSLTSVTIPNSVTSIGYGAFSSCDGLTSIIVEQGNAKYDCRENCNAIIETATNTLISGCQNTIIPNSVTSIGRSAFGGCSGLTSITIPNSVTSIGYLAFEGCSGLTSVTLGNSVTSIEKGAFINSNIQEVTSYASTPPAAAGCELNHTSCTLYVPAEYIDTYSNTFWWEDFKEIRAIDADYVVTFVDWDGTVLASVGVAAGQAATAPADPTREGYTFIGWDKDFSSVTEDMTVTALYQINRYQVRFYDWNDTLLKTDSVDYQSAATAPADPTRLGYTFIGWDKDFSCITADLDVHAQYEAGADKEFEVIFSDQDNNELSAQSVTLRVPVAPQIEGFTFLYWQPVAAPVEDVITLQAVYESNTPTAAPEVFVNPSNPAQKLIRNGQVYILHEDKMYTISGQVVK